MMYEKAPIMSGWCFNCRKHDLISFAVMQMSRSGYVMRRFHMRVRRRDNTSPNWQGSSVSAAEDVSMLIEMLSSSWRRAELQICLAFPFLIRMCWGVYIRSGMYRKSQLGRGMTKLLRSSLFMVASAISLCVETEGLFPWRQYLSTFSRLVSALK